MKLSKCEEAIITKAVQIMARKCREQKNCNHCPIVHVFCSGNRKRMPKDWKMPFVAEPLKRKESR